MTCEEFEELNDRIRKRKTVEQPSEEEIAAFADHANTCQKPHRIDENTRSFIEELEEAAENVRIRVTIFSHLVSMHKKSAERMSGDELEAIGRQGDMVWEEWKALELMVGQKPN